MAEASQGNNRSTSTVIAPLSVEEEDNIIFARITNDERALKRIVKKFHAYTSAAYTPIVPAVAQSDDSAQQSIDDAKEAFLLELAAFQLTLQKNTMICEAEARQVEEYQRERQRIDDEHGTLRGQIEQLKTSLEDAQLVRRRKIEYDLVAEKVNTLPTRDELERSIAELENDMAAIRSEHDHQNRIIQTQKLALDGIITDLGSIRLIGKDKDIEASNMPSPRLTPMPDADAGENNEEGADVGPPLSEGLHGEEKEDGEEDKPHAGIVPSAIERLAEDDIEMGEVEEDPKSRRRVKEDLEEGEASDISSELSDPPDD